MVDWWAVSSVLYELLIGIPPFIHTNQGIMFEKILMSKVQFPKRKNIKISKAAKDLV